MNEHAEPPPIDPEKEKKQADFSEKADRARFAKALLEDKAFKYAMLELRKRWFQELCDTGGGNPKSVELVAKINSLEALAKELTVLINDYKMALRNG